MTVDNRTVTLTDIFLGQLAGLQEYLSEQNPTRGRQLTTELIDFLTDTIAQNPFMFVEFSGKPTPTRLYRRAVFKRTYIIIYKVTELEIVFLTVYHASRNPDSIDLGE